MAEGNQPIYKGANFASFAKFELAFEEWKELYHHPFRVASSEKHEDKTLADRYKYRYVVYHCSRYGQPRKRGAGRRPHQNYLPCGCRAKLRLNFHDKDGALQVTTLETQHNHEPIMEDGSAGGLSAGSAKRQQKCLLTEEVSSMHDVKGGVKRENLLEMPVPAQFSPLSLQPNLINSPSSASGQSSSASEGLEGQRIDQSLLGTLPQAVSMPQVAHQWLQQQQQQSSSAVATSILSAALLKVLNNSPSSGGQSSSASAGLEGQQIDQSSFLDTLPQAVAHQWQHQHQQQKQQQSSSSAVATSITSILSAALLNHWLKESIKANKEKIMNSNEMAIFMNQQQEKVNSSQLTESENAKENGWNANGTSAIISPNGLIASMKRSWQNVFAMKGFSISAELSRGYQPHAGRIIHYYEVTQVSSYGFAFWAGLSTGSISVGRDLGNYPNTFAVPRGCDFCILSGKDHDFELPKGVIKPKWKYTGDVIGCGILVNRGNELAIFFTLNGSLLGKQIPIKPSVDVLIPTVTIWDVSLEANFGGDLDNKPFKYDTSKCPGLAFE